ncbi:UNVERIFIED_CONTAM: Retrovirus-related Pol polyprotein from transposon RE1 [Sesamum calycinum]|uniref:Retrovirus-related Pol polyprotein from transposon RE1 n=1 Tax=Sesamum calycinum TaxID=2727403 RepID=A0AAW2LTN1_9LAMI
MASTSTTMPDNVTGVIGSGGDNSGTRVQVLDHPGMVMISAPLNGRNWLSWSRSVRIALEGRDKLGFIDGSCIKPADGTTELRQWRITDSMVRTWILNTISKDIVNAYLYATSARSLWLDLEARYGECDGPLLYKIQRQISSMSQGNLDVTAYYTNLKQLWDELVCLMPPAMCTCGKCTCGCNKAKIDQTESSQLIQFLMELNETYDNIRNQILVLDPLPNVNNAYSMVLRVERQREVNLGFAETGDNVAMQARSYDGKGPGPKNHLKKKGPTDKRNLVCGHCNKPGHSKETCFKSMVYLTASHNLVADLMETLKMVQNKVPYDPVKVHFAQNSEMAGTTLSKSSGNVNAGSWIVDTGATSHMCGDVKLFNSLHTLHSCITIHLPDNSIAQAKECGDIHLSSNLTLTNVLYVPSFKHNLLSVSQLCQSNSVGFLFLTSSCLVQDLKNNNILAVGKQRGRLYYLDTNSFIYASSSQSIENHISCLSSDTELYTLWHKRLGHASPFVLSHIPVLSFTNKNKEYICSICPLAKQTRNIDPIPTPILDSVVEIDSAPVPCSSSSVSSILPSDITSSHIGFMTALSTVHEPKHFLQAKGCSEWEKAMKEELDALERNNTWEIVDLPPGKKPIGSKWVYKVKLRPDGSVDRYKARLVAKGYNQVEGVDYVDRFSPVAKAVTVRLLLAVASSKNWPIQQIDINNAFLHGFLDEDIYLTAPDGYPIQWEGLSVTQHKYIRDIILDTGLQNSKPATTPLPTGLKFSAHDVVPLHDPEPYRRLVGRLLYLSFTRPDISFGAQQLSQFVHQPGQIHMDAALHLVRYLKGCPDRGLFFSSSNSFTLTAFCDADWASCVDSRRSLTGYCIFLVQALISWKTKKQTTVARSTAEAEYRSLGTTVCELQWLSYLLSDFHISVPRPIPVYCDNQAAIHIVANPVFHERTKHLEIDCHLVRDKFKVGFILPSHISGKSQLADLFTKLLPSPTFTSFLSKLGLVSFPQVQLEGGLLECTQNTNTEQQQP